jgi:hypothetical protein
LKRLARSVAYAARYVFTAERVRRVGNHLFGPPIARAPA